jgi:hypothetical protein
VQLLDLSGRGECRVYETGGSEPELAFSGSFHPKAYVFHHRDGSGAAFIGSSNLSETALTNGVEWNYRVVDSRDLAGLTEIREAFEALFRAANSIPLTPDWIEAYRSRRPTRPSLQTEVPGALPRVIQVPRLAPEASGKGELVSGDARGLVVLATGGQNMLSAFDRFRRFYSWL